MLEFIGKCQDCFTFFSQFIAGPQLVGAMMPSSSKLSEAMTDRINLETASSVVEFGPGTGSFTRIIRERVKPDATFIAIELNPRMVKILNKKYPDLSIYNDSVINTPQYLSRHGKDSADCIVSGLPWAAFNEELQEQLLTVAFDSLGENGKFVTFMYLQSLLFPSGKKFKKKLANMFPHVSVSRIVWENFPPAIVMQANK